MSDITQQAVNDVLKNLSDEDKEQLTSKIVNMLETTGQDTISQIRSFKEQEKAIEEELIKQREALKGISRQVEFDETTLLDTIMEIMPVSSFRTNFSTNSNAPNSANITVQFPKTEFRFSVRPMDLIILMATNDAGSSDNFSKKQLGAGNAKGRWYPLFVGFITTVEDQYSPQNMFSINLSCQDLTLLMHQTALITNQALLPVSTLNKTSEMSEFEKAFELFAKFANTLVKGSIELSRMSPIGNLTMTNMTAEQIIRFLVDASGITKVFTDFIPAAISKIVDILSESLSKDEEKTIKTKIQNTFSGSNQSGLSKIGEGILAQKSRAFNNQDLKNKLKLGNLIIVGSDIRPFLLSANDLGVWENEYMNAREIMQYLARQMFFEFFGNESGQVVFKAMSIDEDYFYTNDNGEFTVGKNGQITKNYLDAIKTDRYTKNEIDKYIIKENELINHSFTQNHPDAGYPTALKITGAYAIHPTPEPVTELVTTRMLHPGLFRRYGWKMDEVNTQIARSIESVRVLGESLINRFRGKEYQGQITLAFRPNLHIGKNIYLPWLNRYYYVTNVSHNFSYGQRATTTLTLSHGRDADKQYRPLLLTNDASLYGLFSVNIKQLSENLTKQSLFALSHQKQTINQDNTESGDPFESPGLQPEDVPTVMLSESEKKLRNFIYHSPKLSVDNPNRTFRSDFLVPAICHRNNTCFNPNPIKCGRYGTQISLIRMVAKILKGGYNIEAHAINRDHGVTFGVHETGRGLDISKINGVHVNPKARSVVFSLINFIRKNHSGDITQLIFPISLMAQYTGLSVRKLANGAAKNMSGIHFNYTHGHEDHIHVTARRIQKNVGGCAKR